MEVKLDGPTLHIGDHTISGINSMAADRVASYMRQTGRSNWEVDEEEAQYFIAEVIAAADPRLVAKWNVVHHRAINRDALTFQLPIGTSYAKVLVDEEADLVYNGVFGILTKDGYEQYAQFKLTKLELPWDVFIVDVKTVGNILEVPHNDGAIIKAIAMDPTGQYALPKAPSIWE